ncbi:BA14K family protein [Methylopila musalis]|uniref:Lectin-like protein BA14k n=1 Tax=Methylopila musalis TaxID=1134781 RepID=A0ABW3Z8W0_9HYPH
MRKMFAIALAGAIGMTGVFAGTDPVSAQTREPVRSLDQVRGEAMQALATGDVQTVRDRRWRGGRHYNGRRHFRGDRHYNRRHYGGRHYYGGRRYHRDRYYGRRYYRDRDRGNYAAAAIAGVAAGALIAGAANSRSYSRGDSYCAQRFRSYNPRTGTYTAHGGRQVRCP